MLTADEQQVEVEQQVAANEEEVTVDEEVTVEGEQQQEPASVFDALFENRTPSSMIGGVNQLKKTAQLTTLATSITNKVFEVLRATPDQWASKVEASQKSHDAMDDLINEIHPLDMVDVDFLKSESEEDIEKMIRSQQSKRSRSKSKVMNTENYRTMLIGAVSENLLRIASGKPKSVGGGVVMKDIGFSDEDLDKLAEFPEELKKAIRNVQSKKSIMRNKADFDPQSPRWLQLTAAEQQLKDIRSRGAAAMSEDAKNALEAQRHAEELLGNIDTENMTEDEAKNLLDSLKEMLASK